jgi:hypothetical protein
MGDSDLTAAKREAFTIGRALFAVQVDGAEHWAVAMEAARKTAASGVDVRGKYQKFQNGYVYVGPNLEGRYYRKLPDGVGPDQVIESGPNPEKTPLRDRLVALGNTLSANASTPEAKSVVEAIASMYVLSKAESSRQGFAQLKQHGMQVALAPSDDPSALRKFFEELGDLARSLQARPAADGLTVASLLIARDLSLAIASAAGSPAGEVMSLARSLGYLIAPSPAPIEACVSGLAERAIREGKGAVVREVAEAFMARGDEYIATARAAPLDDSFYVALYAASAYELAAWILGNAEAAAHPDPTVRKHRGRFAMSAEERSVRIGASLVNAVLNLDGSALGVHREVVLALRASKGEAAAAEAAADLVDNLLYYPRSALSPVFGVESNETPAGGTT